MAMVSRAGSGRDNKNRLRFHKIKVYGQRFPGTIGKDAERGISGSTDYRVNLNGDICQSGRPAADGGVEIYIPGGARATLEMLGTTYEIEILHGIEPHDTLLGCQRRLNLLGYYPARVDDRYGARTDVAALDFQADNGLDPNGQLLATATRDKIRDVFGE